MHVCVCVFGIYTENICHLSHRHAKVEQLFSLRFEKNNMFRNGNLLLLSSGDDDVDDENHLQVYNKCTSA